jgi:PleD family two-component response regulator
MLSSAHGKLGDWNHGGHFEGVQVSVSIGVAEWYEADTLDNVLDRADRKLYEQKGI